MNYIDELRPYTKIFIDTAPLIYYIEDHPDYAEMMEDIVNLSLTSNVKLYSSVLTLTEVLVKPIQIKNNQIVQKFLDFFYKAENIQLIDITKNIATEAGKLRGKYQSIKAFDAIQLASAIDKGINVLITNDLQLKSITEIKVLALKDYLNK